MVTIDVIIMLKNEDLIFQKKRWPYDIEKNIWSGYKAYYDLSGVIVVHVADSTLELISGNILKTSRLIASHYHRTPLFFGNWGLPF